MGPAVLPRQTPLHPQHKQWQQRCHGSPEGACFHRYPPEMPTSRGARVAMPGSAVGLTAAADVRAANSYRMTTTIRYGDRQRWMRDDSSRYHMRSLDRVKV